MAPELRKRHPNGGRSSAPLREEERLAASSDGNVETNGSPRKKAMGKLLIDAPSKWRSFRTRAVSALAMIGFLVACLSLGHVPVICMIFAVQGLMVRELFALAVEVRKEKDLPWFRLQQWYFYGAAVYFTYGRFLKAKVTTQIVSDMSRSYPGDVAGGPWGASGGGAPGGGAGDLLPPAGRGAAKSATRAVGLFLLAHHSLTSYLAWMVGFVLFVLSLRKGLYVYQFGQFAWTHMIIAVVLLQSSCFVANVLDGLIWFVFPVSIVFFNDIAAYLCGFFFGRTPLIQISPTKTWEGFVGGFAMTLAVSPYAAAWLQRYKWLTCPSAAPLRLVGGSAACETDPLFIPTEVPVASLVEGLESVLGVLRWTVPHGWVAQAARAWFGLETVRASWFQVHAVVIASFASLIAPFGGFFASGFKRAFKIKDFSDTIPGHGGITDRMDCQMVMAVFSHLYITNFIRQPGDLGVTLTQLLFKVELFTDEEILDLYQAVRNVVAARGLKLP